jgi:dimethylhistidine N-methyltransferase
MRVETAAARFADEVARDLRLTPKRLQSRYLYDALGSSLFEAICRLPWYRITRAEERLLARHAPEIAARLLQPPSAEPSIIELGVGSGEKLATLVGALPVVPVHAHLVDISPAALDATASRLSAFPSLIVWRHQDTYEGGLASAARARSGGRTLLVFLGSNIGNFDTPAAGELLRTMGQSLAPGDLLLIGADLVKPAADLMLAYDDPLGVTAAFDKNLLVRINRELGADFDIGRFEHRAVWNSTHARVEMHLVSLADQEVHIPAAGARVLFEAGETIWTESSYKYTEEAIADLGAGAGFGVVEQWIDDEARFALTLFEA